MSRDLEPWPRDIIAGSDPSSVPFRRSMRAMAAMIGIGLIAGCSGAHVLVDTPNIYLGGDGFPQEQVPQGLKSNLVDILYVTDRGPSEDGPKTTGYGTERSASMAFGSSIVRIGDDVPWDQLVEASQSSSRERRLVLTKGPTREMGRFPETPLPFSLVGGRPVVRPSVSQEYERQARALRSELASRLAKAANKEIVLFVHGFANDFESASFSLADVWHFTGRFGVPVLYTWPAGKSGPTAYLTDRESGEFTIFHLKEFLRIITRLPDLKRIHIIAHSRGTDVTTSALRELIIEDRAAGRDSRKTLRIENIVLAAPDLDFGVVGQRLIAERFGTAVGQVTIYTNRSDSALRLAQAFMTGTRFGRVRPEDISEMEASAMENVKNVNFIDVEGVNGLVGHAYFRQHPGALSDIVLLIRNRARPGSADRPLKRLNSNFWSLPRTYPKPEQTPSKTIPN